MLEFKFINVSKGGPWYRIRIMWGNLDQRHTG